MLNVANDLAIDGDLRLRDSLENYLHAGDDSAGWGGAKYGFLLVGLGVGVGCHVHVLVNVNVNVPDTSMIGVVALLGPLLSGTFTFTTTFTGTGEGAISSVFRGIPRGSLNKPA